MATTNGRDWIFTHAFSESSFKTYEKNGLARTDTIEVANANVKTQPVAYREAGITEQTF